jgi:hypothetical protein
MLTHEPSPIVVIRRKELDLAERLAAAQRAGEAELQSTRSLIAELNAEAELESRVETESDYRAGIAAADDEAAQILSAGERAAAQIAATCRRHMAAAVDYILAVVLPPAGVALSGPARPAGVQQECLAAEPLTLQRPASSLVAKGW